MQIKKIVVLALTLTVVLWLPAHIQHYCFGQPRETERPYSNRHAHIELIDTPTGCLLEPSTFNAGMRVFPDGGVLGRLSVGIADRFMFGVTYGGTNIIGKGHADLNKNPGVHFKYFLAEESLTMPAIAIGFDSQGYGKYLETINRVENDTTTTVEVNRYTIKSRGFFLVISKNYLFYRNFGVHLGINRSLEGDDGDTDPTIFMGFDLELGNDINLIGEYDFATNDDGKNSMHKTKGYLNMALRWTFMERIYVEFDFKDLFNEENGQSKFGREIKIAYLQPF